MHLFEIPDLPLDAFRPRPCGAMTLHGKSDAPPPPDFAGAASATAAGNLEAAKYATKANRANQYTPYGSLEWQDLGNDKWSQSINLTPQGQALLNQDQKTSQNLANLQDTASGRVAAQQQAGWGDDKLVKPTFNPGETAQDAIMRRTQPMLDRSRASAETRLANQGIQQGSEAWRNAQDDIGRQENDAYSQAALQGISTGQQARQQGIQEQQYFNTRDLNALNALRTGSQVTNPTFGGYAQQATTAGPDMLGAAGAQYSADIAANNANNASSGALMGGLFSLGSAALGAPTGSGGAKLIGMLSDRRLKVNIKKVGKLDNGLNVYAYEYVWGGPTQIGVMAQEVELINPAAVGEIAGYKVVNYAAI